MARKLRLESEGGVYHVLNRGNYRADIFRSEKTKAAFLKCLDETCARTGWRVHAWSLMTNHYHLAVETPQANLVEGMRWLQGTFSVRFNRLRKERGHLFQGRYKSLAVDPYSGLGSLCHYIHLNPVRARVRPVASLPDWPWSSLAWLMDPAQRRVWFDPAPALAHAGGLADTPAGRRKYLEYLAWLAEDEPAQKEMRFSEMSKGWLIGTAGFAQAVLKEHQAAAGNGRTLERRMRGLREDLWAAELGRLLKRLGKSGEALAREGKSAGWKLAIAAALKAKTTVTNRWLGEHLRLGGLFEVSRKVSAWTRQPDRQLAKKLHLPTNHKA